MSDKKDSHFGLLHEIFILDAYLEKPLDQSQCESLTKNLMDEILTALRMEELGPLALFPAVDLRAPGWSFIQPITTSHLSGHYFEKPGRPHIRMDFYSCASVNWRKIVRIIHKHLQLAEWRASFIDRQIDEGERIVLDVKGKGDTVIDEVTLRLDAPHELPSHVQHRSVSLASAA